MTQLDNPGTPNILTYGAEVVPPPWARWLLRPIGWGFFALMTLAYLMVLWEARLPGNIGAGIGYVLATIIFAVLWSLRLLLRAILWRVYRRRWRLFWPGLWRFGVAVLIPVLVVLVLLYEVPVAAGFSVSEPAMRRAAEAILAKELAAIPPATQPVTYPDRWVGIFETHGITYFPAEKSVRFYIRGAGFLNREGWSYCQGALRSSSVEDGCSYTPWAGPWYRAGESW